MYTYGEWGQGQLGDQLGMDQYSVPHDYNHNILRLFDTLPKFIFTTSEAKRDYQ